MSPAAQLQEGIRRGSGLWFYDCPACPCDFGPMHCDKAEAEREAREHDAEYHTSPGTVAAVLEAIAADCETRDGTP